MDAEFPRSTLAQSDFQASRFSILEVIKRDANTYDITLCFGIGTR